MDQGNNEPETRLRIVRMASGLNQVTRETRGRSRDSNLSRRSEDEDDRTRNGSGNQSAAGEPPSVTSIVIRYRRNPQEQQVANLEGSRADLQPESTNRRALLVVERERNLQTRQSIARLRIPRNHRIHLNSPRLTHYIEEPNVGKGFIKELCFSSDGRLICSPFGYGVRLLAFSADCTELSTCVPNNGPMPLHELGTNVCHADIVVSTKFSPRHCLFVSGCLTGRIVWHQPVV